LVGETGSGKSTVALAVMGLLERHEQSGEILYGGHGIQLLARSSWRQIRSKEIGIVFQDSRSALNPVLTVMDHLIETLSAHQKLSKKAARAASLDLLQEVGIQEDQAKLHSFELSGGTCQRAGIALAICNHPRLLIADEPTSSIDTAVQAQILGLLQRMKQRYGLALLLISHDLPLISQVSDRVAVIYHGRIVESGLKEEVLAAPAHPYTRSLLQCQPSFLHHHEENPLASIPGSMPKPGEELPGCAFASRCSLSEPLCQKSVPTAFELSRTRRVSCFHGRAGNS
jgi:oligopeptide/dipeptide ABC transporter ATP-binding protein